MSLMRHAFLPLIAAALLGSAGCELISAVDRSKIEGGTIRVRSRLADGRMHLVIEDDGVGIPDERLNMIFELGIGVSNVNERLKVLYGDDYRMWIDSKVGDGTRTGIEVPSL